MTGALKLLARDADDLKIVAACVQDALLPVGELCYQPGERRFVMVVNRFCWELAGRSPVAAAAVPAGPTPDEEQLYRRVNCGIRIEGVNHVRSRGYDPAKIKKVLSLLTIEPDSDGLMLVFAEDIRIHLQAPRWTCMIEDLGAPWPTSNRPDHAATDPE